MIRWMVGRKPHWCCEGSYKNWSCSKCFWCLYYQRSTWGPLQLLQQRFASSSKYTHKLNILMHMCVHTYLTYIYTYVFMYMFRYIAELLCFISANLRRIFFFDNKFTKDLVKRIIKALIKNKYDFLRFIWHDYNELCQQMLVSGTN